MAQGSRPECVADLVRTEISDLLRRSVNDPGVGFVTITRVRVTSDLQHARVFFTTLGDEDRRQQSNRALERATPFLRRQIGRRLTLKRTPVITFHFDESIEHQARVEQLLEDLKISPSTHNEDGEYDE